MWQQVHGHLAPRHAIVAPWNEVHVDCVGPWTITANNGAKFVFSALTCIDPLLILWILSFWMEAIQELIIVEKDLKFVGFLDIQNQTNVCMTMGTNSLVKDFKIF